MAGDQADTARIEFIKTADYKLAPVTGAWGGVSPQREIIVDFYVDKRSNPDYMDVVSEGGDVVEQKREPDPQPIHRLVQFGAVMRPDIARAVGKFLIEYADKAFEGSEE